MRYIFLITVIILSLNAEIDRKEMYAQVKSKSADLYHHPYECAQKKENFFKKGDMIEIEYCNKYRWCKTTNGFVKKDLLRLPEPLRSQDKPLPDARMVPRVLKKELQRVELIAEPIIVQKTNSSEEIAPVIQESKRLDAYDEYFSEQSAKVIFKEVQ